MDTKVQELHKLGGGWVIFYTVGKESPELVIAVAFLPKAKELWVPTERGVVVDIGGCLRLIHRR